jgi:GntR family transcriptional regulator, transcriptional repressor for pyruvate dehydrogenase complex
MFTAIEPTRVSDEIVSQIRTLISEGVLKPGDQLPPERELMKDLRVSRPTLREALKSLTASGFLEITQAKRTCVKSVISEKLQDPLSLIIGEDIARVFDLIEVRKELEAWNAFHASIRATKSDIKQLEVIITKMKDATNSGRSWEREDADFHLAVAQATHNVIQMHLMFPIYDLLRQTIAKVFTDNTKQKKLLHHHVRIFASISNHSPKEARYRILQHLNYVEAEMRTFDSQMKVNR